MVNFNYAAKYGTKFQDFGSWVDVDYEEFLYDMTQQPELFYINSYIPFMGVWKQKLTETGRVAKNEAVWIPICLETKINGDGKSSKKRGCLDTH